MKKIISLIFLLLLVNSCTRSSLSTFGRGVSVGFDPRTVGMQIDDTIMEKKNKKIQYYRQFPTCKDLHPLQRMACAQIIMTLFFWTEILELPSATNLCLQI